MRNALDRSYRDRHLKAALVPSSITGTVCNFFYLNLVLFIYFFSDRNNPGDYISGTGLCEKVLDLCQCYEAKFLFHKLKPNISSKFWASSSSMMAASYRKARFDH